MREKEPQQGALLQKMSEERMREIADKFRERGLDIDHDGEHFIITRVRESDGAEVREYVLAREKLTVMDAKNKNSETRLVPIEDILETSVQFSFDEYTELGTHELLKRLAVAKRSEKKPR